MTLGQRIQELRKQAGLSQEGLGEALGVSRQAVSKWEGDNGIPELDTLIAISKLFRLPLGQLLGVEEPAEQEDTPSSGTISQEQLEAILRRYSEESRRQETAPSKNIPVGSWIIAGCAVVLAVIMLAVGIGRVRSVFSTVRNLQSQISALQSGLSGVSGQVNSLSDELRQQLEEGAKLISTLSFETVTFDPNSETVTLRFDATLKEYTPGSRLQIRADWTKTDYTEGQTASDWLEGPSFSGTLTVPMNFHMELSVRTEDADGTIREQYVDTVYSGLHPDNFVLNAYNLMAPFRLIIGRSETAVAENPSIPIQSPHPDLVWPEKAILTVLINDAPVLTENVPLSRSKRDPNEFTASPECTYHTFSLREGDTFTVDLELTDNLGRVKTFETTGTVRDGELRQKPTAAPMA